jgi:hypothetical protein
MQASSTSGVSPSDSGTEADSAANGDSHPGPDTVKADHSCNEGSGLGAGAASSSSPRSTLNSGAVFGGEPMPISDTQFLAPRVCCALRHTPLICPYTRHLLMCNTPCLGCTCACYGDEAIKSCFYGVPACRPSITLNVCHDAR